MDWKEIVKLFFFVSVESNFRGASGREGDPPKRIFEIIKYFPGDMIRQILKNLFLFELGKNGKKRDHDFFSFILSYLTVLYLSVKIVPKIFNSQDSTTVPRI